MKYLSHLLIAILTGWILAVSGCDHRVDIAPFEANTSGNVIGDTTYVEITPPWIGFTSPRGVFVGNDQLIYVADYGANEVVMLDAGGTVLNRRHILHPAAIAQNSKLDLYVAGEQIAPNGIDTIAALFRIYLVRYDSLYIVSITDSTGHHIDTTVVSTFFDHKLDAARMDTVWRETGKPLRRFTGISVMPNNDYLVARTGNDNTSFVDPDSRMLLFNGRDVLITPLPELITRPSGGTGINDIRFLTSVFVFPSARDFIATQSSDGVAYGAIWMVFSQTIDFEGYLPKFDPTNPDQAGADFIHPYRYHNAISATYDKRKREIFILDAELDSVSKFTFKGAFKPESFGRYLTGQGQLPPLNHPMSLTFSNDCTLYIADTGNQIIRRFRLSSQSTCF